MMDVSIGSDSFTRPCSLARVGKDSVVCKCLLEDKRLFRFRVTNGAQLKLEGSIWTAHGLWRITSGPSELFLGIGRKRTEIHVFNSDAVTLGTCHMHDDSVITAVIYDKNIDRVIVACRDEDEGCILCIYRIETDYELSLEKTIRTAATAISGVARIDDSHYLIADDVKNEVYVFSLSSSDLDLWATHGREGMGRVRSPKSVLCIGNRFAVIDQRNYLIQFFSHLGAYEFQFGGKGNDVGSFDLPSDIVLVDNRILIADMNNDRIMSYGTQGVCSEPIQAFARTFRPGKLSRPTSLRILGDYIYVCDRDNDKIQVFNRDLEYQSHFPRTSSSLFQRPTAICKLEIEAKFHLAVLSRSSRTKCSTLTVFDPFTQSVHSSTAMPELSDPQGMIEAGPGKLCIMDTLNRRALLINEKGETLKEANLARYSDIKRFLCRVPSLVEGNYFFSDYHEGVVVVLGSDFSHVTTIKMDMSAIGMSNIRKIERHDQDYLLIGRGEHELVIVSKDLADGKICKVRKELFPSIVDIAFTSTDEVFVLLKEHDLVVKDSIINLAYS